MQNSDETCDSNQVRKFIYKQILRFVKMGILKKSGVKGSHDATYLVSSKVWEVQSGKAKALQMDFYSSPTMNQSEIASYLVRGKGLDSSAESSAAMATGIGTSLLSATGVLKELEKIPMLNNIEIESTGTQASISGYVNDKVYVKYGVGLLEPINELTIRLYWLNRFWLESVTGLENSASIYYSFDID